MSLARFALRTSSLLGKTSIAPSTFSTSAFTSLRVPTARYHERVIDHYENPRNVGSMNKNDISVGTGLVGAPACGDVMKLQIKVENGIVKDSCFKTFGCGSAIASSSYVTELIKNKSIEEIKKIKNSEIAKYLSLPPVKLHCSMLAEDAIKAAVKDYEAKQKAATDAST
jgi:Fe-S cluster assembly scaffold IscU